HALALAASHGNIDTVRLLLSSGFDPLLPARGPSDPTTTTGLAAAEALRAAAINGHLNVVRLLADRIHGGDLSALDAPHVFEEACAGGHVETVQFLLDHTDADPAHGGNQALVRAASGGHADVVRVLLADERVRGGDVTVALMSAVRCGHEGVMRLFVRFG
ncbi:ankyrin repeat-containing domain protein, partial [Zopfochytrium polystomum]